MLDVLGGMFPNFVNHGYARVLDCFGLDRRGFRRPDRFGGRRRSGLGRRGRLLQTDRGRRSCRSLRSRAISHHLRRFNRRRFGGHRMTPQFEPDVIAATSRHHSESIANASRTRNLVLNRADVLEGVPLILRKNLRDHAEHGVWREHARGKLDLSPRERPAVGVHRRRRGHHVRLFAHVHHECVAVEPDDCVEQ